MFCTDEGCLKDRRRTYFLVSNSAWQYVTFNKANAGCKLPCGKEVLSVWLVSSFLKQSGALTILKKAPEARRDHIFRQMCPSAICPLCVFCFTVFGVPRVSAQGVNEYDF